MHELKFENAIELLVNKFPDFKLSEEYKKCDQEVTYLVYGAFCQYLSK